MLNASLSAFDPKQTSSNRLASRLNCHDTVRMGESSRRRSGTGRELQRDAVHAVTQASGRRAIVKNVSKMTPTAVTMHFVRVIKRERSSSVSIAPASGR